MLARDYLVNSEKTEAFNWEGDGSKIVCYGLMGEVGSLLEVLKKEIRDKKIRDEVKSQVHEEIGDIIWYLFALARRLGLKDAEWPHSRYLSKSPSSSENLIFSVADVIGEFFESDEDRNDTPPGEGFKKKFDGCLFDLACVAREYDTSLASISEHALRKNEDFWLDPYGPAKKFDEEFPTYEQLPRNFIVRFTSVRIAENVDELIISINGVNIGDRLRDNTHGESGYRYHDVVHMCGAAFLGWSPVFRRMLKRKRKSCPKTDEIEDGGRAAVIEEAIVSKVFLYGKENGFVSVKNPDIDLIKDIMKMAEQYECVDLKASDWKLYVRSSLALFGEVKNGFDGEVEFDADKRSYKIL